MHPASPGIGKPVLRSAHKRVGLFRELIRELHQGQRP
jgi:hypothetical protein